MVYTIMFLAAAFCYCILSFFCAIYYNNILLCFSFPKDDDFLRKKWIEATGRTNWTTKKSSTICSKHFAQNMLFKKKKLTILLPNAAPLLVCHYLIYLSIIIGYVAHLFFMYNLVLFLNKLLIHRVGASYSFFKHENLLFLKIFHTKIRIYIKFVI